MCFFDFLNRAWPTQVSLLIPSFPVDGSNSMVGNRWVSKEFAAKRLKNEAGTGGSIWLERGSVDKKRGRTVGFFRLVRPAGRGTGYLYNNMASADSRLFCLCSLRINCVVLAFRHDGGALATVAACLDGAWERGRYPCLHRHRVYRHRQVCAGWSEFRLPRESSEQK